MQNWVTMVAKFNKNTPLLISMLRMSMFHNNITPHRKGYDHIIVSKGMKNQRTKNYCCLFSGYKRVGYVDCANKTEKFII